MNDYEKKIKEKRTADAVKNDLMGFEGKIGCIVRSMGQPLTSQRHGGTYFDSTPGYDFESLYKDEEDILSGTPEDICNRIPVMAIEGCEQPEGGIWMERKPEIFESIENIGWYFDGLSRGMHIEIKYTEESKELLVRCKGIIVYREVGGDLEAYIPMPEWENMINKLYVVARKMHIKNSRLEKEQRKKAIRQQKESWLTKMRNKWGFKI